MTKFKLLSILLCSLIISSNAMAKMYKWVDEEGNISYSDQPPYKGAEQLDPPAISTMAATVIPKKSKVDEEAKADEEITNYTKLAITSPENDATIWENNGNFSIAFNATPDLDVGHGHSFSVSMDGKVVQSKLKSTTVSFTNIDRGSHNISVSVKDKNGKTLRKSKSITVQMRRTIIRKQAR